MREFAYCRVSTTGQTTDNQAQEIATAGYTIRPERIVAETVSGSVAALERKGFAKLLDRLERGDRLVVTKLDRLGRNAIDVRMTVDRLEATGIQVYCLALGGMDLTSAAGRMTMQVINAMAEFERDLLIERTHAGLARAKQEGKTFGRPTALSPAQRLEVAEKVNAGIPVAQLAGEYRTSRQTIMRVRGRLCRESVASEV